MCSLIELKQFRNWGKRPVQFKNFRTLLSENLGTPCREWPAVKANTEVQMLVEANREPPDIVIYMNGSVTSNRSGWGFLAKQGRRTVHVSMRYLPNLQARETRHKVEQVKVYLSAMQRPKNSLRPNPPTVVSKKKRSEDWQKARHGWAKRISQSNMCAVLHSSSWHMAKTLSWCSSPSTRLG